GAAETWDLEIEGTHNFVAGGVVVHNSELVEWAAARVGVEPRMPDGSWLQWAHVEQHGLELPLHQAEETRGALLFRAPTSTAPGHVAVALGDGTTIEARGTAWGVGVFSARNRFERGGLIPGVDYGPRDPVWPHERGVESPASPRAQEVLR